MGAKLLYESCIPEPGYVEIYPGHKSFALKYGGMSYRGRGDCILSNCLAAIHCASLVRSGGTVESSPGWSPRERTRTLGTRARNRLRPVGPAESPSELSRGRQKARS